MTKFFTVSIAALALMLALVLTAAAGAKTGAVLWRCDPDGPGGPEPEVTFVSAPAAAAHGITRADSRAGDFAFAKFGEVCHVEVVP
jgi:hypothetical protein